MYATSISACAIGAQAQSLGTSSPFNVKAESFFIDRLDVGDIADFIVSAWLHLSCCDLMLLLALCQPILIF